MENDMKTFSKHEITFCQMICEFAIMLLKTGDKMYAKVNSIPNYFNRCTESEDKDFQVPKEEKEIFTACITIYELAISGRYKILQEHFGISISEEYVELIKRKNDEIKEYIKNNNLSLSDIKKKLKKQEKTPARKLYISDLHFFHENINHRMDCRGFSDYIEMNEYMVRKWNENVNKKDEVYILGDFSIAKGKETNKILHSLNGNKFLITGNHDYFLDDKEFNQTLFKWIRPYAEISDNRRRAVLSHYPIFCYNGQYRTDQSGNPLTYMLYGHVHNTHDEALVNEFIRITRQTEVSSKYQQKPHPIPCNMINCFCMFSDYVPLTLDEWILVDKKRRKAVSTPVKEDILLM